MTKGLLVLKTLVFSDTVRVSIIFDTLFRYLFQVSTPYFDAEFRNGYFWIPHHDTYFKYQYIFRYQGIDTGIDTRYQYQRYLTSLVSISHTHYFLLSRPFTHSGSRE